MIILSRLRQLIELPANLDAAVRAMEGKHVADCREINRRYLDSIERKKKHIQLLERAAAERNAGEERRKTAIVAQADRMIAERDKRIADLESTIIALRSGALPWRPIREYERGTPAIFRNEERNWTTDCDDKDLAHVKPATMFMYLYKPTTKPAPKVVAWVVVNVHGWLVHGYGKPLVFDNESQQAEEFARNEASKATGHRAVPLVILEDDNAQG